MIAIIDSGSTKAEWCFWEYGRVVKKAITSGLNPYFTSAGQFQDTFINNEDIKLPVKHLFFYGAGCSSEEKKKFIEENLSKAYPEALIKIEPDILGAARALFGNDRGIACILGTGSNACIYEDQKIKKILPSLGYIFGDEGGGVNIGKLLISYYLKGLLPKEIAVNLESSLNVSIATVIDNVYRKPFPNRYLASFAKFAAENIQYTVIYDIVYNSFVDFTKNQILKLKQEENFEIGFIGSVAWYFKDILVKVMKNYNLHCSVIVKSPMDGLIEFHSD